MDQNILALEALKKKQKELDKEIKELENKLKQKPKRNLYIPAKTVILEEGEVYCGEMISPQSEHYHLIMVPTEKEKFTWSNAYEYQLKNRSLPFKMELLFAMIMVPQYFNVGLLYWTKNELTSRKDYVEGIYKRLYGEGEIWREGENLETLVLSKETLNNAKFFRRETIKVGISPRANPFLPPIPPLITG